MLLPSGDCKRLKISDNNVYCTLLAAYQKFHKTTVYYILQITCVMNGYYRVDRTKRNISKSHK